MRKEGAINDLVSTKICDERFTGLHWMQSEAGFGAGENLAQLHEAMAGAAGVESVQGNPIPPGRIEGAAVGES